MTRPDVEAKVFRFLGLPTSGALRSPLYPGRWDWGGEYTAGVIRNKAGRLVYFDRLLVGNKAFPNGFLTPPEFYASKLNDKPTPLYASKHHGKLKRQSPTLAIWWLRLLVASGVLKLPKPIGRLPYAARPLVRRVWQGFRLLTALKSIVQPGPTSFTWAFAAAWCGVSKRDAGAAIRELRQRGFVRAVDKITPAKGGRPTLLFRAGGLDQKQESLRRWRQQMRKREREKKRPRVARA